VQAMVKIIIFFMKQVLKASAKDKSPSEQGIMFLTYIVALILLFGFCNLITGGISY
jgi:hypothetical protein